MMERLTFDGNFCDIAQCDATPGGSYCESGSCTPRKVWDVLKAYEDTGLTPEEVLPKKMADEIAMKLLRLADLESFAPYERLRELAEADKEGRLIIVDNTPRQASPCDTCESGWGTVTTTSYDSCFNHCEKLAEYRRQEAMKDE